ncbi:hypothetical protein C8J55DRAFT_449966 [Lentinula edodes]|uniref:F-box domain-containing protein n=1 Tax=Lentinula lateritia TaxID=40482 RepID=A0A9W9DXS3_9AGAR|nr:hypothetical protein C8J55DRAFT_449966 [Lentinula edodes]
MVNSKISCTRCEKLEPRVDVSSANLYTKLRSEFGTSTDDSEGVEQTMRLCDRDIDDYETKLAYLRSQIIYIETQRARVIDHKIELRSLLSPIRKLPNEILGIIFDFACNQNLLCDSEDKYSAIRVLPALAISAVSFRWRHLALSSSRLWSTLNLKFSVAAITAEFMLKLKLYLERSGNSPLFLDVKIKGFPDDNSSLPVMDLLVQHSKRWKTFTVNGQWLLTSCYALLHPRQHFPILTALSTDGDFHQEELDIFEDSPQLCSVRTTVLPPSRLPSHQLTHVEITVPSSEDLIGQLDRSPNLTTMVLLGQKQSFSVQGLGRLSRTMPMVRSLVLQVQLSNNLLQTVFSCLTCPRLSELSISSAYHRYDNSAISVIPWPKHLFKSFMLKVSSGLTTFTIRDISISDLDLIAALEFMPSLRSLAIHDSWLRKENSPITTRLIQSLHLRGNQRSSFRSPLVPRLHDLAVEFGGADFDDTIFVGMVASRWLPDRDYSAGVDVDRLGSVVLKFFRREVNKEAYQPLQDLEVMGLRVVVDGAMERKNYRKRR